MKIQSSHSVLIILSAFALSPWMSGCGQTKNNSKLDVSDIEHTPVKRQSIGNCWLYATSTWAESLHLAASGENVNLSESYWTYWDWFNKISRGTTEKIDTSGSWWSASQIIRQQGYMIEGDFIPTEADEQMSYRQRQAESAINEALSTGSLKNLRTRTNESIMAALDQAFDVNMTEKLQQSHAATELKTNKWGDGSDITLADEISGGRHGWTSVNYPQLFGKDASEGFFMKRQRAQLLHRVLKAVNDKKPVIMSSMVEFSALNTENKATFEYDLYIQKGLSTGQGGHLIVLEDYTVDNVPNIGSIGEGDVSPELKQAALDGDVKTLVVKNSWGTDRPDRGLSDGYTRFTMDYLNRPLPFGLEHGDSDMSHGRWYSALSNFVVPPEY